MGIHENHILLTEAVVNYVLEETKEGTKKHTKSKKVKNGASDHLVTNIRGRFKTMYQYHHYHYYHHLSHTHHSHSLTRIDTTSHTNRMFWLLFFTTWGTQSVILYGIHISMLPIYIYTYTSHIFL